jgi:hypothetical protein
MHVQTAPPLARCRQARPPPNHKQQPEALPHHAHGTRLHYYATVLVSRHHTHHHTPPWITINPKHIGSLLHNTPWKVTIPRREDQAGAGQHYAWPHLLVCCLPQWGCISTASAVKYSRHASAAPTRRSTTTKQIGLSAYAQVLKRTLPSGHARNLPVFWHAPINKCTSDVPKSIATRPK